VGGGVDTSVMRLGQRKRSRSFRNDGGEDRECESC
jgi:hypothetical protein